MAGFWCHLGWDPFRFTGHSRESGNPVPLIAHLQRLAEWIPPAERDGNDRDKGHPPACKWRQYSWLRASAYMPGAVYTVTGDLGRRLKAMNATREIPGILWSSVCLVMVGIFASALAQKAPSEKPNELVVGKLIYVAPMPDGLDQWIIDFLRRWGKYKVTSNPEGVDLVIQATNPEKDSGLRRGGNRPATRRRPPALPHPEEKTR